MTGDKTDVAGLVKYAQDLEAEIERLTKERDLALANADGVYARLMPEVERLRAALQPFASDVILRGAAHREAVKRACEVLYPDQQSTPGVHTGYNGDEHTGNRDVCTICHMWDQVVR